LRRSSGGTSNRSSSRAQLRNNTATRSACSCDDAWLSAVINRWVLRSSGSRAWRSTTLSASSTVRIGSSGWSVR